MPSAEDVLSKLKSTALTDIIEAKAKEQCQVDVKTPVAVTDFHILLRAYLLSSGRTWLIRIPKDQEYSILGWASVRPLEYVAEKFPNLPAPRAHGHSDSSDLANNPVGVCYMMLDWIHGGIVPPFTLQSPSLEAKRLVLDQLAELMLDMLLAPATGDILYGLPDDAPKGVPVSTTEWLTYSVDRGIRRALNRRNIDLSIDHIIQRSVIPRYVVAEANHAPWVFVHPDLHNANIIVDSNLTIQGLIDWEVANAVPLQAAACYPKLLANVPGAAPPHLSTEIACQHLPEEKAYFVSSLADKETRRQANGTVSIAQLMAGSEERHFFEMSIHCQPILREFVTRFCQRSREHLQAALREMEAFLTTPRNSKWNREGVAVQSTLKKLENLLETSNKGVASAVLLE